MSHWWLARVMSRHHPLGSVAVEDIAPPFPQVTDATERSVVILRVAADALKRSGVADEHFHEGGADVDLGAQLSVADDRQMLEQLAVIGMTEAIGAENIYESETTWEPR